MPKGLYFTAVVFLSSFFFFRRLISEVTRPMSTILGHIHLWLQFLSSIFVSSIETIKHYNWKEQWNRTTRLNSTYSRPIKMKKLVRTSPGIYPHGLGKKRFFGIDFILWSLTEHISATEHDINNRKEIRQSTGILLNAPKFSKLWSRNGWKRLASFCPPPKFSHWETLPALPHGR